MDVLRSCYRSAVAHPGEEVARLRLLLAMPYVLRLVLAVNRTGPLGRVIGRLDPKPSLAE